MWKDLIKQVKKQGVKISVKIPLTRKIPMDYESLPGDCVDRAMEMATMKSLLKRALKFLDAYIRSGPDACSLDEAITLAEEIRSRVVSPGRTTFSG